MSWKLKGITKEYKNYIKQYGNEWEIEYPPEVPWIVKDKYEVLLTSIKKVHNHETYPFSVWTVFGKEVESDDE